MLKENVFKLVQEFSGQSRALTIHTIYIDLIKYIKSVSDLVSYSLNVEKFKNASADHKTALFLSQNIYWSDRTKDPDGWYWKTVANWQTELKFSIFDVRKATAFLKRYNIIETKRKKIIIGDSSLPQSAGSGNKNFLSTCSNSSILHYRVNQDVFFNILSAFLADKNRMQLKFED